MDEILQIDDIISKIFTFIDCGSDFKTILFTCKRWNVLISSACPNGHIIFANHLLTLLKLFPNANWDYYNMSCNPNITWDFVLENPDKYWSYDLLSSNVRITWEIVRTNPDKKWDYYYLSKNPNITYKIVKANPNIPWDWSGSFHYL